MNNIELIREAIDFINAGLNDEAITKLEQIVLLNTPKPKAKGKVNIWDWVAGNRTLRESLKGVYFDVEKGVAVATNSHVLIISKPDAKTEGQNRIISPNGDKIQSKYVQYDEVIPDRSGMKKHDVDREKLVGMLQKIRADKKLKKPVCYLGVNICGEDAPFFLDPAYAKLLLTLPDGEFHFSDNEYKAMRYDSADGNYIAVFMPLHRKGAAGDFLYGDC